MKKGLSILLIAAALFGFYGGATNLNDVLACKDYWEKKGEETTANFNKLEDGINQLKENEQAYLDGVDQLAEGEKALAEGEKTLEEGRATLAQGEADYAAAPQKLADGKAQLDANKDSYTAGSAFKQVVDQASNGLSDKKAFGIIKKLLSSAGVSGVPDSYKDLEDTLASLNKLKAGTDNITGMDKEKAFKVAVGTQDEATQKKLAAAGVTSYKALNDAIKQASDGLDSLNLVKSNVDNFTGKPEAVVKEMLVKSSKDLKEAGIEDYKTLAEKQIALTTGKKKIDTVAEQTASMTPEQKKEYFVKASDDLKAAGIEDYATLEAKQAALSAGKAQIDKLAGQSESELKDFFVGQSEDLKKAGINDYATLEAKEAALSAGKAKIDKIAAMSADQRKDAFVGENADLKAAGINSYAELTGTIDKLQAGKDQIDQNADQIFAQPEEARKEYFVGQNAALKEAGIDSYAKLAAAAEAGNETAKAAKQQIDGLAGSKDAFKDYLAKENAGMDYATLSGKLSQLQEGKGTVDTLAGLPEAQLKETLVQQNADLKAAGITTYDALDSTSSALTAGKKKVDGLAGQSKDDLKDFFVGQSKELAAAGITDYATLAANDKALTEGKAKVDALSGLNGDALKDALVAGNADLAEAGINNYATLEGKEEALRNGKKTVDDGAAFLDNASSDKALQFVYSQLSKEQQAALKAQGVDGTSYKALTNAIAGVKDTKTSLNALKAGTDNITDMNNESAFKTAVGTQNKATQKQLKDSGITSYKALTKAIGSLKQLDGFTDLLTSQKGNSKQAAYKNIVKALKNAGFASMVNKLPDTYDGLAGALQTYEDGVRTYQQGLADYAAAPAKLEDGRKQVADGEKALAEGKAQLAAGKEKLAEYEDGEQQVRDGLAIVMGTAPDGGLQSILERRNGDDDFDNGDNHLELDEGLDAVNVGRGYQADSGELVTKEITNRAIGTGLGVVAAVLAVLAAILSFLKKNKGAGALAILSAAAGGIGTAMGVNAGMEFSSIAGSLVGATPWISFGILAGVAVVHAVAHFAGNKAE